MMLSLVKIFRGFRLTMKIANLNQSQHFYTYSMFSVVSYALLNSVWRIGSVCNFEIDATICSLEICMLVLYLGFLYFHFPPGTCKEA